MSMKTVKITVEWKYQVILAGIGNKASFLWSGCISDSEAGPCFEGLSLTVLSQIKLKWSFLQNDSINWHMLPPRDQVIIWEYRKEQTSTSLVNFSNLWHEVHPAICFLIKFYYFYKI